MIDGVPLEPDLPESAPEPDVVESLTADAVGAHASEASAGESGGRRAVHTHCENCGTKLAGPWCHECGQHDFEFHRSFGRVLMELLDAFLNFDSKLFRSTKALLFRPGWLTDQFNAGRRASQMPPLRLYLFVAFVFFLVMHYAGNDGAAGDEKGGSHITLSIGGQVVEARNDVEKAILSELTRDFQAKDWADSAKVKALAARVHRVGDVVAARTKEMEAEQRTLSADETREMILGAIASDRTTEAAGAKAGTPDASTGDARRETGNAEPAEAATSATDEEIPSWAANLVARLSNGEKRSQLAVEFVESIPKILLVCLPLFALLTRGLFWRKRDFVYLKHLVLALHFHAFIYLWILLVSAVAWVAGLLTWWLGTTIVVAGVLWATVYLPWMFRRLFGGGWGTTIVKSLLLVGAHTFIVITAFGVVGVLLVTL
jgi:hypothetical protein